MTKPNVYISKLEKVKACAATGFRIKQYMYNIVRSCYKAGEEFPYRYLLEHYCIPGTEAYLKDHCYYLLKEDGFILSERTITEKESFLRKLAERTGGTVGFTQDNDPVLVLDGYVLNAASLEGRKIKNAPTDRFITPYELYPRIIDIKGNRVLVEVKKEVCDWKDMDEYKKEKRDDKI